ncbi:MAG: hypothetical protein J5522_00345, partial [Lachnospiraceae bacterium]|nr:hypothetical protein [Lachnospiraceae bacterium]
MKKTILLVLIMIITAIFYEVPAMADEAATTETITPDTPAFTISVSEHEELFTFTIQKTANADGYRIYAKEPGSSKYRIIATIKKNGKAERTYTYSPFNLGKYSFKIKAYHKNGSKKTWSKASTVVKVNIQNDIFSRVPVGIRFAEDTKTEFRCGGDDIGENEDNPYTFEYECDEKYKDAEIRLFIVRDDGMRRDDQPFLVDEYEKTLVATRMGEAYAVLYAFGKSTDVNFRNPLARSEKLLLKSMDENGNTAPPEPKYADITFKDGYAYFGLAPVEYVSDKALKAKIITATHDRSGYHYNGDRYFYNDKDDIGPFKYVPAEWRILKKTDDYALLMTNYIINGGGYDGYQEVKTTTWKTSCLYYMLNQYNDYKKSERTFGPVLEVSERVLMEMDICGQKTKLGIPTVEMLTNKKYGFSTSKSA